MKNIILIILCLPGFNAAINFYDGILNDIILQIASFFKNKDNDNTLLNDAKNIVKFKEE